MTFRITNQPFLVSKTTDKFYEVIFDYGNSKKWIGCVPTSYKELSLEISYEEILLNLNSWYEELRYENRKNLINKAKIKWGYPSPEQTETGRVFLKLLEGNSEWVCRTCGTGKINDQPAARIRDIKKRGYIIATKTRDCNVCYSKTYQDILLLITVNAEKRQEYRMSINDATRRRIISVLNHRDSVFDVTRGDREFVIDHKFPSQRWNKVESRNHPGMSDVEIKNKFQLLNNQTNMLKSRFCDDCVETGNRGTFMGISWFHTGGDKWVGDALGSEKGCFGCPWHDIDLWRKKLVEKLRK